MLDIEFSISFIELSIWVLVLSNSESFCCIWDSDCCWLSSKLEIDLSISSIWSSNFLFTLSWISWLTESILSGSKVTCNCLSTRPLAVTDATPSTRSNLGITSLLTYLEISSLDIPSTSTLTIITGIISGFSFIRVVDPTESSKLPLTKSTWPLRSIIAESILVSWENSSITILTFSFDIEVIFSTPLTVENTSSSGFVTVLSTFSGLAPGYVVYAIT